MHAPPSDTSQDPVDALVEQWRRERPDLAPDLDAMALFARLGRLVARAGRAIDEVLDRHGLTVGEFDVLAALRRGGDPFVLRPTQLSRTLILSPAAMTNRLDRLEAAGRVRRQPDPDDRRGFLVVLTPAGRALVDEAVTEHLANEVRLLMPLSSAQRAAVDDGLRTLLGQFE